MTPTNGVHDAGLADDVLGMRELPRNISDFEMKVFFTFDGAEREAINARRGNLGLGANRIGSPP